jgi:hypothetical protein
MIAKNKCVLPVWNGIMIARKCNFSAPKILLSENLNRGKYEEMILERSPHPFYNLRIEIICQTFVDKEDLGSQYSIGQILYRDGDADSNVIEQETKDQK